jgi:hypothetical protein
MIQENQDVNLDTTNEGGEGGADTIQVAKKDYESLNQTLGSLKRELKDLKKAKDTPETPTKETKTEDSALLQKLERLSCRQAGVDHPDDIELAKKTAKKWGVDIDDVLADEDFKVKLEKQRTQRSNDVAASVIPGSAAPSEAKNTAEYWVAKNAYPTAAEVPSRKARAAIARAMMKTARTSGKTFYND